MDQPVLTDVVSLTIELISRPSITQDDSGCQTLIAERLQGSGFACEHLR
ncbi:hypothetical protein I6F37_38280, partial [Bradyrhizobium sp. NBAIM08]|nr:hypothetical protein [Bradyrhizobium sp. NBAIM08]